MGSRTAVIRDALSKCSANSLCSSSDSVSMDSPKSNVVVVARVKRKKAGWRSTTPLELRKLDINASTCSVNVSRSFA